MAGRFGTLNTYKFKKKMFKTRYCQYLIQIRVSKKKKKNTNSPLIPVKNMFTWNKIHVLFEKSLMARIFLILFNLGNLVKVRDVLLFILWNFFGVVILFYFVLVLIGSLLYLKFSYFINNNYVVILYISVFFSYLFYFYLFVFQIIVNKFLETFGCRYFRL